MMIKYKEQSELQNLSNKYISKCIIYIYLTLTYKVKYKK